MARIAGVDLPGRKHISIALRYLYGVGPARAVEICEKAGIPLDKKAQDLSTSIVKEATGPLAERFKATVSNGAAAAQATANAAVNAARASKQAA